MHQDSLIGVLSPLLTPFNDDFSIAESLLCRFAQNLLQQGCAGLVLFGTTGEALSVGVEARQRALAALVESGIEADKLIIGAGLCNFEETAALCSQACQLNCRGVMLLPPFYYKNASDDGLFDYFALLIQHIAQPRLRIYLYHIPATAGMGFSQALVRRLKREFADVIVGIKDSSGEQKNTLQLLEIDNFSVYPGSELYLDKCLQLGSPGCITASANLNAAALASFISAYRRGEDCRESFAKICQFRRILQKHSFIAAPKRLLQMGGYDRRWANVCPPLSPCDEDEAQALQEALQDAFG